MAKNRDQWLTPTPPHIGGRPPSSDDEDELFATPCSAAFADGLYKLHRSRTGPVPGILVYLARRSLLFFNIDYIRAQLKGIVQTLNVDTRWLVFDASVTARVDSMAAATLPSSHLRGAYVHLWTRPMMLRKIYDADRINDAGSTASFS